MTATYLSNEHKAQLTAALMAADIHISYEGAFDILTSAVSTFLSEAQPPMTDISLQKILAIIDDERGTLLKERKQHVKGTDQYGSLSRRLDLLNKLKRRFSIVSNTDEPTLGL